METIPENSTINYSPSQSNNKYYYQNDFELKIFKKLFSK